MRPMEDDPYLTIVAAMRGTAKAAVTQTVFTGVVLSVSPLMVETGGLVLSGDDLLIDRRLLNSSALSKGARVGMVTADQQTYLVLCEVVRA